MLGLWLIACHMVGDYIFQNQWQADNKFKRRDALLLHCVLYTLAFVPLAFLCAESYLPAIFFLFNVFISHLLIDKQKLYPNHPWPLKGFYVDQTLHVLLLAIYGTLFLSSQSLDLLKHFDTFLDHIPKFYN